MATKLLVLYLIGNETEEILDLEKIEQYSQMKNYRPGDVIKFLGRAYICNIANGIRLQRYSYSGSQCLGNG